ncbi:hypothetical protein ASPVEDRAFT_25814 [Aspergillus versicolor CBS 583.65]|uniref:Uncharacterized protein n=1 Tax=Aspergillus versicolor CBS 583.65 TaxID=1036611 RepID=A0A1L9PBZ7_ASPVE|nr:uncharacterized protein ASPVEDRAFT_25814 [Aspergillus versicolor CBS 583.65]OJI98975.1 hypothetical protein ASPVEDRAFT_25814 [Aspergillus versicolor CBS 583.65]
MRTLDAFLRLGQDYNFDEDCIHEMTQVNNGQADLEYCHKLGREARAYVEFVENHGVKVVKHEEKNIKYPPATSVLRSLTFGRLAGTTLANKLSGPKDRPVH